MNLIDGKMYRVTTERTDTSSWHAKFLEMVKLTKPYVIYRKTSNMFSTPQYVDLDFSPNTPDVIDIMRQKWFGGDNNMKMVVTIQSKTANEILDELGKITYKDFCEGE